MRRSLRLVLICGALVLVAFGWTKVMARIGSGTPPVMASPSDWADVIRVSKADRRMDLMRGGEVIASYRIALGGAPEGHKQQEGDQRTPEGAYLIDWRNENSVAHLSLHISYPNAEDSARAEAEGVSPGGSIMIHGLPNGWGLLGVVHRVLDWTDGCIAVTNAEMQDIWSRVPNGTPIMIEG